MNRHSLKKKICLHLRKPKEKMLYIFLNPKLKFHLTNDNEAHFKEIEGLLFL